MTLESYNEIWLVDFEFSAPPGETPHVLCMVAREFKSGKTLRHWRDDLLKMNRAPFDVGDKSLFVAYYASAEMGCFLALGWPRPAYVLDLFIEFRNLTNGVGFGASLIGALQHYGLPSIDSAEKDSMRDLAMRGGEYTYQEKQALIEYCETDVVALLSLLAAMFGKLDLSRSLLRGYYTRAVAQIEHNGIPLDQVQYKAIITNWDKMQRILIDFVDVDFNVYEDRTFKRDKFISYLARRDIPWPVLESGALDMRDDTFKQMATAYPELMPLRELRETLSGMRLSDLAVGKDGRNRTMLSMFRSKTGRNQPSNAKFIFGPAVWLRCLIKPEKGNGIAYIDWEQQEFGIAAALSEDELMMKAYRSGDPYLEFAKQAKSVPLDATKASHKAVREQFKACVLAVQYGMGPESLAKRINKSICEARYLLDLHRETYKVFWRWSDSALDYAMLSGKLPTVFGWQIHVGKDSNPRSLRNFPMQANGAEMLRLACIYGIEEGIKICAPVHDAVLIEAPLNVLDEHIATMQAMMAKASRDTLGGFELRTGVEKFVYPERYMDDRGKIMWGKVQKVLEQIASEETSDLPDTELLTCAI